jgi:ribosome-associated protein
LEALVIEAREVEDNHTDRPTSRSSFRMHPHPIPEPTDDAAAPQRPSKTQRKQASHELQALGAELAALPLERIDALPLGDALRAAVLEYRRTRSHEGRRRQMQFIGRLMRGVDAEPIRQLVDGERLGSAQDAIALHQVERWRADLIAGDDALTRWIATHPDSDAQRLRGLVRNARADAAVAPEQRSGRAYRELFRYLREHLNHE